MILTAAPGIDAKANIKTAVLTRCFAKGIDFSIVLLLNAVLPHVVGALLGFLYMLVHDGLFKGQSPGKRFFHLNVLHTKSRQVCSYRDSAIRNSPLGVATFFAIIPFWGWILLVLVGVPLVTLEIYLMATRADGYRLGDIMADTQVVEDKNPSK